MENWLARTRLLLGEEAVETLRPVSYTHLTLPMIGAV